MGGVSTRVCLVNTKAYRHSCLMATGCYLSRTTVCLGPDMARPPAEICRLSRLRYGTCISPLTAMPLKVRSNVPTTILLWSGALSHTILSGLPLRIFFCKGSCRHYQTSNREWQIFLKRVERIYRSLICLIACQHA